MVEINDSFGRTINYLRVSITDRCNLRCRYCMPPEGVAFKPHSRILRYEEIASIVKAGISIGIDRVRITGGEPLVRAGVEELVAMLNRLNGLKDISMTTNGTLLAGKAESLKRAGLDRVNISLDTLDSRKYQEITLRDRYQSVREGIEAALARNLNPVKINVVLIKGVNDNEIEGFIDLTRNHPLHVRFIEYMPFIDETDGETKERFYSLEALKQDVISRYNLEPTTVQGNGPARYFKSSGGRGSIGFISPVSHKFCGSCNRLRLTADGRLKPCLANDIEVSLKPREQGIGTEAEILEAYRKAIRLKPSGHYFEGNSDFKRNMFEIGG